MNRYDELSPHVAVIGTGVEPCPDVPAYAVVIGGERLLLSPSRAADLALIAAGADPERIHRWRPGVDRERFTPAAYRPEALPRAPAGEERIHILHLEAAGLELATEAFLIAHDHDPRLHLLLAGDVAVPHGLGSAATALGPLPPDRLAHVYASADLLLFADPSDLLAQPVLEAQASGLPVLAVEGGGASELIESGRSGCLVEPSVPALAAALAGLARRATLRERLVTGALIAIAELTWERSLEQLAELRAQALVGVARAA
jgi:glycosyltransferase involved in cell wall biosynthesis